MADAKTSGDGKISPFGKNGGPMPCNDFVKNPAGSAPGGRGTNFLTNPGGQGPTAPTPADMTQGGMEAQKPGEAPVNPESAIKDKGLLVPLADVPPGSPRAALIGVGSMGNTSKPFKGI
jgi:hypothetical protein